MRRHETKLKYELKRVESKHLLLLSELVLLQCSCPSTHSVRICLIERCDGDEQVPLPVNVCFEFNHELDRRKHA